MDEINNWAILFAAFMPLLVGLVTKQMSSSGFKSVVLLALSTVNGVLTDWFASPDGFDWSGAIFTSLAAFLVAVGMHFGIWKKTLEPPINIATANLGLGKEPNHGMRSAG